MKQKFLSALCLITLCASFTGSLFAQNISSKKRQISAPVVTAPSGVATNVAEASIVADDSNGAMLNWSTDYEIGTLGFNIIRVSADGSKQQANINLIVGTIASQGDKLPLQSGASYRFYDENGSASAMYYIETVSTTGIKQSYGPYAPVAVRDISKDLGYNRAQRDGFAAQNSALVQSDSSTSQARAAKNTARSPESTSVSQENQKWVAAQPGVKIRVRNTGMYRITRSQLQTAGFNVASTQDNWQLYLDGVQQSMLVEPSGNYIEFYGHGIDHPNTDSREYYLVTGPTAGARIAPGVRRPFGPNIQSQSFRSTVHFEERLYYINDIVNGDLDNWFGAIVTNASAVTKNITVNDLDTQGGYVNIEVAMHGFQYGDHNIRVKLNGNPLTNIVFNGKVPVSRTLSIKSNGLNSGVNTFEFQGTLQPADNNLVDYVEINYPRLFKANQNVLSFDTAYLHSAKVTGFTTSDVRVFDLSIPSEPLLITNAAVTPGSEGGFDVNIPSGRNKPLFAVANSALLTPVSLSLNTPSTLSASNSTSDMLIISHPNFMSQANDWANYRRAQGLGVDVVNVEDVYDEFDFGIPSPDSIKSYLQHAITAFPNFKYVLLVGDATYDSRNYSNAGYNDFIPTRFVNTSFGESSSDEALGDMDNDGVAEMSLGRLPVRNASEVPMLLGKVTSFENVASTSLVDRGALFVSDNNDGYDFQAVSRLLAAELPAAAPRTFIDRPQDPDVNVIRQLIVSDVNANNGRFIVNYTGHGSTRVWSTSQMFRQVQEVPQLTNGGNKLSLFLMLTCLNGFYTDPVQDNLAEALFKSPNGGSATTWASTGSTTPDIQQIMATRFFHILGQGTHARLGDAIKASKLDAPNSDVPLTWALMGDPALKIK